MKYRPLKIPSIRTIEQFRKNKDELFEYLLGYDSSLKSTDSIEILDFEYGVKILYYHKDGNQPYKTKVYLNKMGDTKLLR
jgi:hypothetical protein